MEGPAGPVDPLPFGPANGPMADGIRVVCSAFVRGAEEAFGGVGGKGEAERMAETAGLGGGGLSGLASGTGRGGITAADVATARRWGRRGGGGTDGAE